MSYTIKWSGWRSDSNVGTYEDAKFLCAESYEDAVIGHDGDLESGGDRTLVWANEEDAKDDDGSRAVASIHRTED
jgi:hypothetical protein